MGQFEQRAKAREGGVDVASGKDGNVLDYGY